MVGVAFFTAAGGEKTRGILELMESPWICKRGDLALGCICFFLKTEIRTDWLSIVRKKPKDFKLRIGHVLLYYNKNIVRFFFFSLLLFHHIIIFSIYIILLSLPVWKLKSLFDCAHCEVAFGSAVSALGCSLLLFCTINKPWCAPSTLTSDPHFLNVLPSASLCRPHTIRTWLCWVRVRSPCVFEGGENSRLLWRLIFADPSFRKKHFFLFGFFIWTFLNMSIQDHWNMYIAGASVLCLAPLLKT